MTPLVFVDCETDGLHPGRRAWEIAMIRRDDDGERECRMFLPLDLKFADPAALKIGGFWDRHPAGRKISGKPEQPCEPVTSVHDAAKKVMAWTFGAHLIGANPAFDAQVLERLLRSEGYMPQWHYRLIDVEALTSGAFHRIVGGLAACMETLHLQQDDAHTALGDARAARAVYDAVIGGAL